MGKYGLNTLCATAFVALLLLACSQKQDTTAEKSGDSLASTKGGEDAVLLEPILADEAKLAELVAASKGKVLVLNFWATWCPPCVKEMPDFAKFYKTFPPEKVAFISLSANEPKKIQEEVVPFQQEHKLPFPIYVLSASDPDKFYGALGVELSGALPATVIYGKDGVPKHIWEKDTTFEELKAAVEPML